jgi:hypothetical protein
MKHERLPTMSAYRNDNLFLRVKTRNGAFVGLSISYYGGGGVYALRLQTAADGRLWWIHGAGCRSEPDVLLSACER